MTAGTGLLGRRIKGVLVRDVLDPDPVLSVTGCPGRGVAGVGSISALLASLGLSVVGIVGIGLARVAIGVVFLAWSGSLTRRNRE